MEATIRVGWVSSVDAADRTVRVTFEDKGEVLVSGPLSVLRQETPWLPRPGDFVLCLYPQNGGGDGFVMGGL